MNNVYKNKHYILMPFIGIGFC